MTTANLNSVLKKVSGTLETLPNDVENAPSESSRHLFQQSAKWIIAAITMSFSLLATAFADERTGDREFTLKILPLLKAKCFGCHGDDSEDVKGAIDVRSREALLRGGESGEAAIVPGNPDASPLYRAVMWDGLEMPPKENDRLTAGQIELVRRWIAAGAPWPDEATQQQLREEERSVPVNADGEIVKTSGGLSEEWTYRRYNPDDLWAFRPVARPDLNLSAGVHPIDTLIESRLAVNGVAPAPPADPRILIRRATFDLTGLPPTPEEIEAFLTAWKADEEQAWEGLIDRLLASPHYGERSAQHWFDITRYADTGGMANDYERSNMWRYRDYVIRAFNADKPYDRFVIEQLAGDELADESALQRLGRNAARLAEVRRSGNYTEDEANLIAATGFLRMGPWDNAMVSEAEARQIYLDDLVNSTGQTFLATTMRCLKCHDHKFDPIPTRDYYRLYAAFAGTQMAERPVRFTSEENRERFGEGKAFVQRMLDFARNEKQKLIDKRESAAKAWYAEHNLPYKTAEARQSDPDEVKPARHVGLDYTEEGQLKVREQDEWIWTRALERYEPMIQGVYNGPEGGLAWNAARKLRMPAKINASWTPKSYIYTGGSLEAKGAEVQPGVLSVIGLPVDGSGPDSFVLPEPIQGRRLALARWIAHPNNPLTTRAIVNRVWQHHFGKPIAGNPNNFGAKGARPTHSELLDFLAADFVEHGWTFKRLHKLIMLSRAYRMSSRHPQHEKLRDSDPNNDLMAFFPARRLTAEEMRDAMLAITGELNPELGGLPVMPEINLEVALQPRMIQFSLAPAWQPSRTPQERNRRSIYAYRVRGQADPFLEVFNQPNPNDSCEVRDAAAVSPQAFTMFNSDLITDRSIALAKWVQNETENSIDKEWDKFDVPVKAGENMRWVLDEKLSDEFNGDLSTESGRAAFKSQWRDTKPDHWSGPGATYFSKENYQLKDGVLTIRVSRVPKDKQIPSNDKGFTRTTFTSYITSEATLGPGSYSEIMMKGTGTTLSANFWMIDDGNQTEIDVVEIYGDTQWFRQRPASAVHFQRRGGNGDVHKQVHHPKDNIDYADGFHRYGVHWINKEQVEFYYDGQLVRTLNLPQEIVDPSGKYLDKPVRLIIDLEAHAWRGLDKVPSDDDLKDSKRNNMQVQWVRTLRASPAPNQEDAEKKPTSQYEAQVKLAFQRALGRSPTVVESERLIAYLQEMENYHRNTKPQPVTYPTRITRSLVEEFTGKTFEYDEILPVFENYIPDKKAADVNADTRAFADLCLLLFNSHEFTYLE